jgi:Rab-like protein 3
VRILVVGDSGVGKTTLTQLIAQVEPSTSSNWTVGAGVEVKIHEYAEGTPAQKSFFLEFWDIGGSISHQNTRSVFYQPTHGIILVHDITNKKSYDNLQHWLIEILNKDGKDVIKNGLDYEIDPEQFLGQTQIPILMVSTKLDLLDEAQRTKIQSRSHGIANIINAEELFLNCRERLAAGSTNAVKLSRFFDNVIERKYYARDSGFVDRKRPMVAPASNNATPYTSPYNSLSSPTFLSYNE